MGLAHSSQRKSRKRREKKITELSSTFEWEISANIGRESKKRTTMEDSIEIRKIWINEFTELQRRHRYTLTTREREKNMKENCARIIAIVDVKHERREKTNPYEPNTTFSLLFILIVFYSFFFSSHSKLKEHEALRVDEQQRTHTLTFQRDEL